MKLLYATNNISKVRNMRRSLAELPIETITPKELGIKIDVVEDGKTAIENAIKKAQAYYDKTKLPTIAGDSGLFIEGVPDDKQPGLFVRRVNGKTLTDDEMIEYYTKLIASIGGKSTGYYVTGLALITEQGLFTTEINEDKFILSSTISNNNHHGNPLDVMIIDPISQKFYTYMTDKDFKSLELIFDKECATFLEKNLLNNDKTLQRK